MAIRILIMLMMILRLVTNTFQRLYQQIFNIFLYYNFYVCFPAIDDVNTYSDSDSDDEYSGEPFYLQTDGDETLQSKNIRYQPPDAGSKTCENSEDMDNCDYYTPKTILTPSLFPNVPPYLNYSSHARSGPSMPPHLHKVLKWKLSPVMPKIVKRVVLNSGFRIIKSKSPF